MHRLENSKQQLTGITKTINWILYTQSNSSENKSHPEIINQDVNKNTN